MLALGLAPGPPRQFDMSRRNPDQMPRPAPLVPFIEKWQPCVTKQDTLHSPQASLGKSMLPVVSDGFARAELIKIDSQWTHRAHATHDFLLQ